MIPKVKDKRNSSRRPKWRDINYVLIYRMLKAKLTDIEIAKSLGCSRVMYWKWHKSKPVIRKIYRMVEREQKRHESLAGWVYDQLSPELKRVWREVRDTWKDRRNGSARLELLFAEHGKVARQHLLFHALVHSNFNITQAMKKLNVSKAMLDEWRETDRDFGELLEQIEWHKGNFFEGELVDLVKRGHPGATIFVNKTYNRNRGYGSRTTLDVNMHGGDSKALDLLEISEFMTEAGKQELLIALRKVEEKKKLASATPMTPLVDPVAYQIGTNAQPIEVSGNGVSEK